MTFITDLCGYMNMLLEHFLISLKDIPTGFEVRSERSVLISSKQSDLKAFSEKRVKGILSLLDVALRRNDEM